MLESQFQTGFRMTEKDPPDPGLYQNDDGTVTLIAPDGTASDVGQPISPYYNLGVATGASVDLNEQWKTFFLTGKPVKQGGFRTAPASIPFHAGAAGLVAVPGEFSANNLPVPADNDAFDLAATLVATNTAGTQVLVLAASAFGVPAGGRIQLDWTTANVSPVAGTDLQWDGTTVTTTAGGVFCVGALFSGGWD